MPQPQTIGHRVLPPPFSQVTASRVGGLLAARKILRAPFRSVTVKVKCETLIPATDHRAFLTSWESLVTDDVSVEYEQTKVDESRHHTHPEKDGLQREGGDQGGGNSAGTSNPSDRCVGWSGWPGEWPKTIEETKGQ